MKVIFEKNKIEDKYIYDFKEFDEDITFFNELYGDIYAGCLDIKKIDTNFESPLLYVDDDTVIGLFFKPDIVNAKYKPLTRKYEDKIEIVIEDGEDFTETYHSLQKEIQILDIQLDCCEDEKTMDQLIAEQEKLKKECEDLMTPTIFEDLYFAEKIEETSSKWKKVGTVIGIVSVVGLGILGCLKKLKK